MPRGLDETYVRILYRASQSLNAIKVERALKWVACARRHLKIEELQEATAFDSSDQRWDAEKVPDAEKLLQSCHGLIVRDKDSTVRFAHHTVCQFLLQGWLDIQPAFRQYKAASQLCFTKSEAEVTIAEMCATYLCFSDFESALTTTDDQRKLTINTVFKRGGPVAVPGTLGIHRSIYDIPYRIFGGQPSLKVPDIDFAKHVRSRSSDRVPSPDMRSKYGTYIHSPAKPLHQRALELDSSFPTNLEKSTADNFEALLGYVIDHWAWHTNQELVGAELWDIDEDNQKFLQDMTNLEL